MAMKSKKPENARPLWVLLFAVWPPGAFRGTVSFTYDNAGPFDRGKLRRDDKINNGRTHPAGDFILLASAPVPGPDLFVGASGRRSDDPRLARHARPGPLAGCRYDAGLDERSDRCAR